MSSDVVIGDWGSTRLRLWRLDGGNPVERRGGPGIAKTGDPAAALLATLDDWPGGRVILCGMVGAREGLHEVAYVPCPAAVDDWATGSVEFELGGRSITIAAGLACRTLQGRPDVMRGEEAQLFGAMALDRQLAEGTHWVVLPGTHSKWARLKDGGITGFRTFLTGELFALLGQSSLLAVGSPNGNEDATGFSDGLDRATEGGGLSGNLFEARSAQLCDGKSPDWARGFVSGLLIGAELQEMAPQGPVVVIGEPELAERYRRALDRLDVEAHLLDGEECAIAGLRLLCEV